MIYEVIEKAQICYYAESALKAEYRRCVPEE